MNCIHLPLALHCVPLFSLLCVIYSCTVGLEQNDNKNKINSILFYSEIVLRLKVGIWGVASLTDRRRLHPLASPALWAFDFLITSCDDAGRLRTSELQFKERFAKMLTWKFHNGRSPAARTKIIINLMYLQTLLTFICFLKKHLQLKSRAFINYNSKHNISLNAPAWAGSNHRRSAGWLQTQTSLTTAWSSRLAPGRSAAAGTISLMKLSSAWACFSLITRYSAPSNQKLTFIQPSAPRMLLQAVHSEESWHLKRQ